MTSFTVAAFYKFVEVVDLKKWQELLQKQGLEDSILGTLILAEEGLNGTIAGKKENILSFLQILQNESMFNDLDIKFSTSPFLPFQKFKVMVKKEIVTFGQMSIKPNIKTGQHVDPMDWNALLLDPEVYIIDTRNHYETELGKFRGARDPGTDTFRNFADFVKNELDPNKNKKIAMYCTGGIRCEKASSYLLELGFENVYQLKGGILKYLETIDSTESLWQGECFIFDNRVTIDKNSFE